MKHEYPFIQTDYLNREIHLGFEDDWGSTNRDVTIPFKEVTPTMVEVLCFIAEASRNHQDLNDSDSVLRSLLADYKRGDL